MKPNTKTDWIMCIAAIVFVLVLVLFDTSHQMHSYEDCKESGGKWVQVGRYQFTCEELDQ